MMMSGIMDSSRIILKPATQARRKRVAAQIAAHKAIILALEQEDKEIMLGDYTPRQRQLWELANRGKKQDSSNPP